MGWIRRVRGRVRSIRERKVYMAHCNYNGTIGSTRKKRTSRSAKPLCSSLPGQSNNPLFVEFYPHSNCDCYKINLPWTKYRKHTLVLCDVSEGIEHAKTLARQAIVEHLDEALAESIINPSLS